MAASWLLRRAFHALLLLLAVSLVSFLFGRLAPGNFFNDLRLNPQIQPSTITRLEQRYGLGQPAASQYAAWLLSAAKGDFGASLAYQRPVAEILAPRAWRTFRLTLLAFILAWSIALPLALIVCLTPFALFRWLAETASAVFSSIPELLLSLLLLYAAVRFGGAAWLNSLTLPVAVLVAGSFPVFYRHARNSLQTALAATFTRAARAQGIRGPRLWFWFVLPAAANPLISLAGLSFGGLLGGSLVVEVVFSRPGIGPFFLEAIAARDLDIVTAVMLLSALLLIAGNLAADLLLALCDPRVRSTNS